MAQALALLDQAGAPPPNAVGHRLVHGGRNVREHCRLTPQVMRDLQAAVEFAPLHVPSALQAIDAVSLRMPGVPQAICLDTAFHRTLPDVSRHFALPLDVAGGGVERYGFHGLSLESILPRLQPVPARLIVAHLGGGCSLTAILRGKSIDTTMGLSPTGGIMMGTRTGDLDPGVMLYLLRHGCDTAEKLADLVDHHSGLLGVSQLSSDMRELEKQAPSNPQADLAVRMFHYQVRKAVGALAAALGGLDMLVFTGGIGEHNTNLRDSISRELAFLGTFETRALPSQEDLQIATITAALL